MLKFAGWVGTIVFGLCVALAEAWVIARLWQWFVVPIGVKPIGMVQAYGINAIVGIIIYRAKPEGPKLTKPALEVAMEVVIGHAAYLGTSFILAMAVVWCFGAP